MNCVQSNNHIGCSWHLWCVDLSIFDDCVRYYFAEPASAPCQFSQDVDINRSAIVDGKFADQHMSQFPDSMAKYAPNFFALYEALYGSGWLTVVTFGGISIIFNKWLMQIPFWLLSQKGVEGKCRQRERGHFFPILCRCFLWMSHYSLLGFMYPIRVVCFIDKIAIDGI